MNLLESALAGLEEARRHIGQSLLSLLGLVLGTGSIVTVLALFGGQAALTQAFIAEVGGLGTVIVRDRDQALTPSARELASKRLTYRDAAFLKDRATSLLPQLRAERLEEIGIDFSVLYPSSALIFPHIERDELRQVTCRAFSRACPKTGNSMAARSATTAMMTSNSTSVKPLPW